MSRLRKNIATVFDVFAEVAAPPTTPEGDPWILWKYPEDYNQYLKELARFSFPFGVSREQNEAVQLFSFVFTDGSGNYTFGYCRYTPSSNTCLCILSGLPWTNLFYRLLNHLASVMNNRSEDELEALLVRAYHQEVPSPGETFSVESSLGKNKLEVHCPDHTRLPTISDNRNLMEYYSAVNEDHMICIFASLLCERRIVFTGRKLSQLSSCVMAASMLIYPLHWQHIFVPVIPEKMFGTLSAPMPYLIGISTLGLEDARRKIQSQDLNDLVILDIDKKTITSPFEDWKHLPPELLHVLKSNLRRSNHMLGDGLARSFLRAMVVVLGGYRRGFVRSVGDEKIRFDPDKFVSEQPRASAKLKEYLTEFRHVQIFEQFVDERLRALNAGEPIQDEFESEAMVFDHRHLKHGGAKDLANPVMFQQAYESVIEKGMGAWSDIQGKMSKIKEASLRPQGMSPPNMRRIQRPLSAAGTIVKEKVNKIPKYRKSKYMESLDNKGIEDGSVEERKTGVELRSGAAEVGKEATEETGERSSSRISATLFSDKEIDDIMSKRTSILVKYDDEFNGKESDSEDMLKSSKSLSDLLSLEIPGDSISTGSADSSTIFSENCQETRKAVPWLSSLRPGFHASHSAANLHRKPSPIESEGPCPSPSGRRVESLQNTESTKDGNNLIDLGAPKMNWDQGIDDVIFDPLLTTEKSVYGTTIPKLPPARGAGVGPLLPFDGPQKPLATDTTMELLEELFMPKPANGVVENEPQKSVSQLRQKWEQFE